MAGAVLVGPGAIRAWQVKPTERGLYIQSGEAIPRLWEKLFAVESFGDLLAWLPGFVFQLSPMENTEKPLFVWALAYFRLLYEPLLGAELPFFSAFNLTCLIATALIVVRAFRRVAAPGIGWLVAVLMLSNVTVLMGAMVGTHSLLGTLIAVGSLSLYQRIREELPSLGQAFLAGLGCSALVFTSHHVVLLAPVFVALFAYALITTPVTRRRRWSLAGWFLAGMAFPIAYFAARDLALAAGCLDAFRRPAFAAELAQIDKAHAYVTLSPWEEGRLAAEQGVPVHFGYFPWLLLRVEGGPMLLGLVAGVAAGAAARLWPRRRSLRVPLFTTCLLLGVNVAGMALFRLPHISRAYIPSMVLASIIIGWGAVALGHRFGRRVGAIATIALLALALGQLGNLGRVRRSCPEVIPRDVVALGRLGIRSPGALRGRLSSLRSSQETQVLLPPHIWSFHPTESRNVEMFCAFGALQQRGLRPLRTHVTCPADAIEGFGEHHYFQLIAGQPTLKTSSRDREHWRITHCLTEHFEPFTAEVFSIEEIESILRITDAAALSCEALCGPPGSFGPKPEP